MVQEVDTCVVMAVVVVVVVLDGVLVDIMVSALYQDVTCEGINEVMHVLKMENCGSHHHWVAVIHASLDDKVKLVVDKVTLDDKVHLEYVEDTMVVVVVAVVVGVDTL